MDVRFETPVSRLVAEAVSLGIVQAIKQLHREGDSKDVTTAINACATVAHQWAWQNSDEFNMDMHEIKKKAYDGVGTLRPKEKK